jgi:hypothetical protein
MTNIDRLRLAFERRYPIVKKRFQQPIPPMQAYLAIPIRTRLILLAIHDANGKPDEAAIKAALPYAKQTDVRLTSKEIKEGLELLKRGLEEPAFFIDLGGIASAVDYPEPDRDAQGNHIDEYGLTAPDAKPLWRDSDIPQDIERTFRWVWYPSAAPLLIGPMVPASIAAWSLKMRLCLYLLIVQECERDEVCELLGCSAWFVRRCIEIALKEFAKELEDLKP